MKKTKLNDGTDIYCISTLEAQMLDLHIAGYFNHNIKIEDEDTIIDVGANIGIFGYKISKTYNDVKIFALEPIDDIFNVKAKDFKEFFRLVLKHKLKLNFSSQAL